MRRRILSIAGVTLAAVAAVTAALWLTPGSRHCLADRAELVTVGMHRSEVENRLGGPPGNYSRRHVRAMYGFKLLDGKEWVGDDCAVVVWFDADGHVTRREVTGVYDSGDHWWGRLRRWLGG